MVFKNDGTQRYHRYTGAGVSDPSGDTGWASNDGNEIGHGWQSMQHIFGGVSEVGGFGHVVFGVGPDGDLHWYRYTGSGQVDLSGVSGWDPRSQNVIGHLW